MIDEVSRSSFTPEVHTSTLLLCSRAAAKPPRAPEGRAGRRGEDLHAGAGGLLSNLGGGVLSGYVS